MKGMELSRRYWQEVGLPAFQARCPQVLERAAVGLVGEGSECFGFDDELSRDHDWGPGFCLWLSHEDMASLGERAQAVYRSLPEEYMGFRRLRQAALSAGRVGVLEIGPFYARFLGLDRPPQSNYEWRCMPEAGLSTATNGEVFGDPTGQFTAMRDSLLAYYPEDVRRKKLAARCALAAQSGQYNYQRCLRRGEHVAAALALAQFIEHAQAVVFLLNRRYRPYYKWTQRAMRDLPILGAEVAGLIDTLASGAGDEGNIDTIEAVSALIIQELARQELSANSSDFLLSHAEEIQSGIRDDALRAVHLMSE